MEQVPSGEVDERFIKEWLAYGFKALNLFLKRHAEFDEYLKHRLPRSK